MMTSESNLRITEVEKMKTNNGTYRKKKLFESKNGPKGCWLREKSLPPSERISGDFFLEFLLLLNEIKKNFIKQILKIDLDERRLRSKEQTKPSRKKKKKLIKHTKKN